jgi:hypothetical protein
VGLAPAVDDLTGVGQDVLGDGEVRVGVEAEDLLGAADLLLAEGGAVRLAGVLQRRGGPADDRPHGDERGPVGDRLRVPDRLLQRDDVLAGVDPLGVPAVGLVAGDDVLAERDGRVVLDRDVVVVVEHDQVAEALVAGQRRRFGGDALLHVAVTADHVDVVVERRFAERGVRVEEPALAAGGHRHAHAVRDALAQWAGRHLDPERVAVLRVARGAGAEGPQRFEVAELEAVPGEVKLDVLRQRAVPVREDEPVAADPGRIGGVVAHHPLVEQIGQGRQAHGGARVAVADLLHGVGGQEPGRVHRLAVEVGPPVRVRRLHAVR